MSTAHDVTTQMQQVWASADFNPVAVRTVLVGELLVLGADIRPGERVLDVAAGTGNTALAAARRGAEVTASDFVPALLDTARRRAAVDGLVIHTEVADAQQLPWPDDSFDAVLSTFGAMFAPDRVATAHEMLRVCRSGGRIGLANWTPDGLVGASLAATREVLGMPPQPVEDSPLLWGTEEGARTLLADAARVTVTQRSVEMCAQSPAAMVEFPREYLAPTRAAFAALTPDAQQCLASALQEVFSRFNRATDGTLVAPASYLEVIATAQ
jgi:ubiquinone/menaquinone biosynthesis C-methylase UbiE